MNKKQKIFTQIGFLLLGGFFILGPTSLNHFYVLEVGIGAFLIGVSVYLFLGKEAA